VEELSIPGNGAPALDAVITQMLSQLLLVLPLPEDSALPTTARLVNVAERPLGLANRRGSEVQGPLGPLALKGGRLDAAVGFEVWGSTAMVADSAALALHGALAQQRDVLRGQGFLRVQGADFSVAEKDANNAFRKTASYRILYEYQYLDADAAASLIVSIPAEADLEELGSPDQETTVITGDTGRWDEEAAAPFQSRGPGALRGLSVLAFVQAPAPTGGVTLLRTFDGAAGPPAPHATVEDFLTAVCGPVPAERHAQVAYANLPAFLADLTAFLTKLKIPLESVEMDGWNENALPNIYQVYSVPFPAALGLDRFAERFEISYESMPPATPFDHKAVLYLRVER
jgi:hypothetical protein